MLRIRKKKFSCLRGDQTQLIGRNNKEMNQRKRRVVQRKAAQTSRKEDKGRVPIPEVSIYDTAKGEKNKKVLIGSRRRGEKRPELMASSGANRRGGNMSHSGMKRLQTYLGIERANQANKFKGRIQRRPSRGKGKVGRILLRKKKKLGDAARISFLSEETRAVGAQPVSRKELADEVDTTIESKKRLPRGEEDPFHQSPSPRQGDH